jgi:DNA-binding NtrC family response regulator
MRLMAVARERNPEVCVILIADYPDIERATEAMRQGAYDFQTKPVNLEKLEAVIQRAAQHQRLVLEQHELRRRLDEHYGLAGLVGNSRQMVKVYNTVRKVAPAATPVLIHGESGTGKDLLALAIHNNSPRRDEVFVKVQCGGQAQDRLDVELFGSAAGASSSGGVAQPGCVELADKGTLFVDEVGGLTPAQQAGLLQVIRDHRVQRIGDGRAISVDVRVIAATSQPVSSLLLGEDLSAALRSVVIEAPPLRERREDIPLLVHHFMREASRLRGVPVAGINRNALDLLVRYDWPANVRELKNIVEGMVLMSSGAQPLDVKDIPQHIRQGIGPVVNEIQIPIGAPMREVERRVIEETLRACRYSKTACAKMLGIGLRTLYRKLKEYDLR